MGEKGVAGGAGGGAGGGEDFVSGGADEPDLVKFDWFDHSLAGADEMLEERGLAGADGTLEDEALEGVKEPSDDAGPPDAGTNSFFSPLESALEAPLESGQDAFFGPLEPGLDEPLESGQDSFFGALESALDAPLQPGQDSFFGPIEPGLDAPLEPGQDSFFGSLEDANETLADETLRREDSAVVAGLPAARTPQGLDAETRRKLEVLQAALSQSLRSCCLHLGELEQQRTFAAAVASAARQTRAAYNQTLQLLALTEWIYEPLLSSDLSHALSEAAVGAPGGWSPGTKAKSDGISTADSVVSMPDRGSTGGVSSRLSPLRHSADVLRGGGGLSPLDGLHLGSESHPDVAAYKAMLMSAETAPGKAYICFFQLAHPDLAQVEMPIRSQLLASLRRLARRHAALEEDLGGWESQCNTVLQQVSSVLLGAAEGSLPIDTTITSKVLSGFVRRRSKWLAGSRAHAERVRHLGEEVLQLESAREGKFWSEGAGIELDAFAGYHELLTRLHGVSETLGAAQAEELAARQAVDRLRVKVAEAERTIEALQVEEAGVTAGLELQAGLLVGKAAEMEVVLPNFYSTLMERLPLFCVDLGKLLKELCLATERKPSARDVHAMARRTLTHHTQLLHTFRVLKPLCVKMQQALESVNAAIPFPPGLGIEALLSGVLMPPTWTAARANQLMDGMAPCVVEVQPLLQNLLQVPLVVEQLCGDLESLEGAASHVALAIQSHHALSEQGPAITTPPGPSASMPTPALFSTTTTGGSTAAVHPGAAGPQVHDTAAAAQPVQPTAQPGKAATSSSTAPINVTAPSSVADAGIAAGMDSCTADAAPASLIPPQVSGTSSTSHGVSTSVGSRSTTDSVLLAVGQSKGDDVAVQEGRMAVQALSKQGAHVASPLNERPASLPNIAGNKVMSKVTPQPEGTAAAVTEVFHFGSVVPELLSSPEPPLPPNPTPPHLSSVVQSTGILPMAIPTHPPPGQDNALTALTFGQQSSGQDTAPQGLTFGQQSTALGQQSTQTMTNQGQQCPLVFGAARSPSPSLPPTFNASAFPPWYQPPPQPAALAGTGPLHHPSGSLQNMAYAMQPSLNSVPFIPVVPNTMASPNVQSTPPAGSQSVPGPSQRAASNAGAAASIPLADAWVKGATPPAFPSTPHTQADAHSHIMAPTAASHHGRLTETIASTAQIGSSISNAPGGTAQPQGGGVNDLVFGTWGVGGPRTQSIRPSPSSTSGTAEAGVTGKAGSTMMRQRGEPLRGRRVGVDVEERRKAYVSSLLKKCIQKIEGREAEQDPVVSVPDQVEVLIQQAASLDNLCRMYEGWTPWI